MIKEKAFFATIITNFVVVALLLYDRQFYGYESQTELRPDTTITIDTTPPPPIIIQMPRQEIPKPIIIYVDSSGNAVHTEEIDTTIHKQAKVYKDSLEDENLKLYYESTVKGDLLAHGLDYKLKVPKLVTKTIEIEKPYPVPTSSIMVVGGAGGNLNKFSSANLGLHFISAKGWSVGYEYDFIQQSHQVKVGVRLFNIKPRKKK